METGTISDAITALATLLLAGAAIGATIAAFTGLHTWKKQSLWGSDYEFARRALLTFYRYRDTLFAVRHPAMSNAEMRLSEEERSGIRAGDERGAGVINAYARRWEKHASSENELEAVLLEADAIWGPELRDLFTPLFDLRRELFSYIMLHIDANLRGNTDLANEYRTILRARRDVLYDMMNESDDFRRDFLTQLKNVEDFLRPKLGRPNQ